MRSKEEIINLVLDVAQKDERVRVVGMNGSRVNSAVPADSFQDFDVVFLVRNLPSFLRDDKWLSVFGKRMIMQKPEAMSLFAPSLNGWFTYLMLFEDENRIDLMLIPIEEIEKYLHNDTLTRILLDKDGLVKNLPIPTDKKWLVQKPSESFFIDCCNEFWWLVPYVVKGVCRQEFLYAADHLQLLRNELIRMLSWKVGFENSFSVSVGKNAKYLEKFISKDIWNELKKTYKTTSYIEQKEVLESLICLFEKAAQEVACFLTTTYPQETAHQILAYTRRHLSSI